MSNFRHLGAVWFNGRKNIGIVLVQNPEGELKSYIHSVIGIDEEDDCEEIAEWGSKFPVHIAISLIKEYGNTKVTNEEWVKLISDHYISQGSNKDSSSSDPSSL